MTYCSINQHVNTRVGELTNGLVLYRAIMVIDDDDALSIQFESTTVLEDAPELPYINEPNPADQFSMEQTFLQQELRVEVSDINGNKVESQKPIRVLCRFNKDKLPAATDLAENYSNRVKTQRLKLIDEEAMEAVALAAVDALKAERKAYVLDSKDEDPDGS